MKAPTFFEKYILNLPIINRVLSFSKKIVLPGFEGVSLYDTGVFFIENLNQVNLRDRSAAVTYNFITALPSILLFLFTLIPYLPLQDIQVTLLSSLKLMILDQDTYQSISKVLQDFMNNGQRSLLSFSLLLSLFFASEGIMGLMRYFDRDQKVYVQRSGLKRRWEAIKLTLLLILVVLVSTVAIIIQSKFMNEYILQIFDNVYLVRATSMVLNFSILFSAISLIYIYGPSLSHRFRFFSLGAIMSTILIVLCSVVFFYISNNFLNYNKVYGSIGSLLVFFVWLNLSTRILMLGYDLNVSILTGKVENSRKPQKNQ